jgi:hypothetical protein
VAALAVALAGCVSPSPAATSPAGTSHATKPPDCQSGQYLGVYEQGITASYTPVSQFTAAVGRAPNILVYYSGWYEPFQLAFAQRAQAHAAIPFAEIQPDGISMTAIAAGQYDSYLRSYAAAVRAYGHPVTLTFAHEMNGSWYSWGSPEISPATWVAAWRHVVTVFRAQRASNVTWVWAPNAQQPGMQPVRDYWPGSQYVTWVGIDGYLQSPSDTFSSVFGPTISAIRQFTSAPILISETSVGPASGQVAKIPGIFTGIKADHLLGMVWFDQTQHGSLIHQDWRIEDSPAAVAAFRHEITTCPR